ncbi:hypothetical protein [Micromonospora sp. LOL_023]|uniref:hypothetical protein n=1 Tax=Micromonospora sp. LOL_023 TaxID=3345418 RepID=UPI003A8803AD
MGRRTGDTGHEGDEGQAFADDLEQGTMYRQEVLDDVIAPPNNVQTPPEVLRDGGPTRSGGGLSTTPTSSAECGHSGQDGKGD